MKKLFAFLLVSFMTVSFIACNSIVPESSQMENRTEQTEVLKENAEDPIEPPVVDTVEKTTYPQATVPVYTKEGTTRQETESVETTPIQTEESTVPGKEYPPYLDLFTSFMEIPDRETFVNKRVTILPEERWKHAPPLAIFRVVGMEDLCYRYNTLYQIQFVDFYGVDTFDSETVYVMDELGHVNEQIYGRPPLEIGELYARLWVYDIPGYDAPMGKRENAFFGGIIYKVEEENGKRYLYPYCIDLSHLECKIPITDPEENCPYKKGKHDKAIAYLKEHNIPLPTYEYKVEAGEYYKECKRRCP